MRTAAAAVKFNDARDITRRDLLGFRQNGVYRRKEIRYKLTVFKAE